MCGISGVIASIPSPDHVRTVQAMVDSHARRGPDHQAVASVEGNGVRAVLGHARLAVIDLSPQGNQPLSDPAGRYHLVCNGEIYNYLELRRELEGLGAAFVSEGDTEVLLQALIHWGDKALDRLRGMFALALFDKRRGTLLLARDRFGVKPLYWAAAGGRFLFSSTTNAPARILGLEPNPDYLSRGLATLAFERSDDVSPYLGLSALPAGHLMEVRFAGYAPETALRPWYDLGQRVQALRPELAGLSDREAVEMADQRLGDSVMLRLRSDVPVGVVLSGGVDSSIMTDMASRNCRDLDAFHFGHPDDPASEGPQVARICRRLGIPVHYAGPGDRDPGEILDQVLKAQDAPFPGLSILAQHMVFSKARNAGTKVLLGGQGGDEVFMGYRKYHYLTARSMLARGKLARGLAAMSWFALAMAESLIRPRVLASHVMRYRTGRKSLLRLPAAQGLELNGREVWRIQKNDILNTSLPTLLRYEDRNSMDNGVESRLMYMDHKAVELGLALPEKFKLRSGYGKWVLRMASPGRVPRAVVWTRRKRGFDVNEAAWISMGMGRAIRERIRDAAADLKVWLPRGTFAKSPAKGDQTGILFSDHALATRPERMADAITLCWLGMRARDNKA